MSHSLFTVLVKRVFCIRGDKRKVCFGVWQDKRSFADRTDRALFDGLKKCHYLFLC